MARRPPSYLWLPPLLFAAILGVAFWCGPEMYRRYCLAGAEGRAEAARAAASTDPTLPNLSVAFQQVATAVKPGLAHISVLDGNQTPIGHGSGWVWSEQGHIVTCNHVVQQAIAAGAEERLWVRLADGFTWPATIVGCDPDTDMAVLKVEASPCPKPLPLAPHAPGDAADVRQGEWVFAFGSPLNFPFSMTHGIVSQVDRRASLNVPGVRPQSGLIQTDAPLNPGHSGGPLTDGRGRVVGMNIAIATGDERWFGVGLATPVARVERVANELIARGRVARGYLGVHCLPVQAAPADGLEPAGPAQGLKIERVLPGTPAAAAGLQDGDVMLELAGRPLRTMVDMYTVLGDRRPGERVEVKIRRGEENSALTLTLGARPGPTP